MKAQSRCIAVPRLGAVGKVQYKNWRSGTFHTQRRPCLPRQRGGGRRASMPGSSIAYVSSGYCIANV
eukprot:3044456-Rhodomonas_salina.3